MSFFPSKDVVKPYKSKFGHYVPTWLPVGIGTRALECPDGLVVMIYFALFVAKYIFSMLITLWPQKSYLECSIKTRKILKNIYIYIS